MESVLWVAAITFAYFLGYWLGEKNERGRNKEQWEDDFKRFQRWEEGRDRTHKHFSTRE